MIDGNICNGIMHTSSTACCYVCNAKPTKMNNLDLVKNK